MFRAVLLAGAIANTAAFIAPSRAPQCLAPQLAAGRAAVLPRRALPTASVTRRDEDDKRIDVLQVCPARHGPVALRATRAWPRCLRRGYGGRKGSPESIPTRRACEGARAVRPGSSIRSKPALSMEEPNHVQSLLSPRRSSAISAAPRLGGRSSSSCRSLFLSAASFTAKSRLLGPLWTHSSLDRAERTVSFAMRSPPPLHTRISVEGHRARTDRRRIRVSGEYDRFWCCRPHVHV